MEEKKRPLNIPPETRRWLVTLNTTDLTSGNGHLYFWKKASPVSSK